MDIGGKEPDSRGNSPCSKAVYRHSYVPSCLFVTSPSVRVPDAFVISAFTFPSPVGVTDLASTVNSETDSKNTPLANMKNKCNGCSANQNPSWALSSSMTIHYTNLREFQNERTETDHILMTSLECFKMHKIQPMTLLHKPNISLSEMNFDIHEAVKWLIGSIKKHLLHTSCLLEQ